MCRQISLAGIAALQSPAAQSANLPPTQKAIPPRDDVGVSAVNFVGSADGVLKAPLGLPIKITFSVRCVSP
jgi:hypothetical protein